MPGNDGVSSATYHHGSSESGCRAISPALLDSGRGSSVHDRAPVGHPLRRPALRARSDGAGDRGHQRAEPGHRRLLRRSDDLRLQGGVRAGQALPRPARVRVVRRHPREPRLAERRLRPLRGAVRRPQLGAAQGRRHRRRGRLDRARPRPRPDRPRTLRVDRGAVRARRPTCASSSSTTTCCRCPGRAASGTSSTTPATRSSACSARV